MFDNVTKSVRVLSAAAVEKANSGHPGMPLGMADVGVAIYKNALKASNKNPDWINRDRFVLSAGHGSMLLYSLLHFNGFDISMDDIKNFRQLGSVTAGHPEKDFQLGIDTTTGPLGQGFANGVGLAVAERYLSSVLGEDIIDHYIYGIISDGDLMEGISTEAAELAGLWKLGKIIYFFDDNNISIDGNVTKVSITNQKNKFLSMGWDVLEIDGHQESEIIDAIKHAQKITDKPSLIIAKSTIGKYSPNKANSSGVHGSPLGEEEFELFLENIGHSGDPFAHSSDIYDYFNNERERDNKTFQEWKVNLDKKISDDENFKILWEEFNNIDFQSLSLEWSDDQASRVVGGKILNEIGKSNKFIIGGSADLAASTKQIVSDKVFGSENYSGNTIEFGAKVPFYRSKENSDDYATTSDVILEVLDSYKSIGKNFDIICCLYPTAPLINSNMLVDAYDLMLDKNVDSVITVTKFGFPIWRGFKIDDDKKASYIWPENELKRSQDLEPVYHDVGQFYFLRVDKFLIQKKLVMKNNSIIEIPESKVQDIDNLEDWKLAEIKFNLNRS